MSEIDPIDELRALVSGARAQLARWARGGVFAVPAGATPRRLEPEPEPERGSGETLAVIRADLGDCTRCKLHETRTNIVFGVGGARAPLMFVGEAPGADEDRLGEPFVGKAGQLLDKMIEAMGWTRETVYIANTLKCRPPNNRDPQPDETSACREFLRRQIASIAPEILVTLGRPAAHLLLDTRAPISRLRGRWHMVDGVRVMPTFHPAYLLRDPSKKRDAWADLKLVIEALDDAGIEPPRAPKA